jgi:hypothetical protein
MPSKNPAQRLSDIVENIDAIEAFTAGMDLDAFATDRRLCMLWSARGQDIVLKEFGKSPEDCLDGIRKPMNIRSCLGPVSSHFYRLSESSKRTPSAFCDAVRMLARLAAEGLPFGPSMRIRLLAGICVRFSSF